MDVLWVELCPQQIHMLLSYPQYVNLLGNRVIVDEIS